MVGNGTYDVLVVGAGIIGSACAFRLAEQGLRVGLLEAAAVPAAGSTGRSAAGVRVQFSSAANVQLSWDSIQEYARFRELYGTDSEYRPIGYLFLIPEAAWEEHLAGVAVQRAVGAPVEVLTPEAAQELVRFNPAGVGGATFGPSDGVVDPHGITMTYLQLARNLGAALHLETELLAAEQHAGSWRVKTNRGNFEAPVIVNAAGPWAGQVGRRAGLSVPVEPVRRMVFASAPLGCVHSWPLTIDMGTGFYFRSEGRRLLMGKSNPVEPPGFTEGIDWAWLEPTISAGLDRFPWLEDVALDQRASWWGYYEVTPDNNPILGEAEGAAGWVNACGFSGHGVQQAAAVGRAIAEEVCRSATRTVAIDEFRIERFARGLQRAERNIV